MAIASINPATGEVLRTYDPLTPDELEQKLQRAVDTFHSYRCLPFERRSQWMARAAGILEDEKETFARLMTTEMGKTLKSAVAEAEKCARTCHYYADHAEQMLADAEVATDAERSYIHYQPLGPVLAIMPWNFPFWQVIRFAAPGLMAGNVGLLKHASNVPGCALAIEDLFRRAGFPEGVFQTLLIGSDLVEAVLNDPRVAAATLTGSEAAGSSVATIAGKRIKKTVLELGGSDPFIVMPSADLAAAVTTAVQARVVNNGQSCIAAKRFIVHADIYDEFSRRFADGMRGLKVGNPLDEATDVGPLAMPKILEDLENQVQRTVALGARVLTGGRRLDHDGGQSNFYEPTVLVDIPRTSPAYVDEIFGPVASLFRAADIEEAIRIANDTTFGLGASVWTNEPSEIARFVDEIQAGQVFVNAMVASDPRLPFGGIKHSGYGRELSVYGIREFVNVKAVSIKSQRQSSIE